MSEALYLKDSYLKECDAVVKAVNNDKYVVLDKTIFYASGGGQPNDTGVIINENGEAFNVVYVGKFNNEISHEVDKPGLKAGERVKCKLNWERRHKLMRMHTAAHLLSAIVNKEAKTLITGNQLDVEKSRIDFNLEAFNKEIVDNIINKANEFIKRNIEVKTYFLPREEALKIPGVVKLAGALPPDIDELRIVEIVGLDIQADGGTHVNNLSVIGKIELVKTENKGKNNRRIYFAVN